jgi:hypothetical protein
LEEKYANLSGHNNSHKLEQIFGTSLWFRQSDSCDVCYNGNRFYNLSSNLENEPNTRNLKYGVIIFKNNSKWSHYFFRKFRRLIFKSICAHSLFQDFTELNIFWEFIKSAPESRLFLCGSQMRLY